MKNEVGDSIGRCLWHMEVWQEKLLDQTDRWK